MSTHRECPYCKLTMNSEDYWKHLQDIHPKKFVKDEDNTIELYKDYLGAGMPEETVFQAIQGTYNIDVKKNIKNKLRWSILYFYGSYGLFYLIALLYRPLFVYYGIDAVEFSFHIAELNKEVVFHMELAELVDIAIMGIFFPLNAFFCYSNIQYLKVQHSKRSKSFFIIGLIFINFGIITHLVANQIHNVFDELLLEEGFSLAMSSSFENLYNTIYFWDEWVSHFFTGLGLSLLIIGNVIVEVYNGNRVELSEKSIKFMSLLVGGGIALGLIEGQMGVLFLLVAAGALLIIPIIVKVKKVEWSKKPFTTSTVYVLLGYLLAMGVYFLFFYYYLGEPIKSYYPYFPQITELGLF
jgi:hypothetical protein